MDQVRSVGAGLILEPVSHCTLEPVEHAQTIRTLVALPESRGCTCTKEQTLCGGPPGSGVHGRLNAEYRPVGVIVLNVQELIDQGHTSPHIRHPGPTEYPALAAQDLQVDQSERIDAAQVRVTILSGDLFIEVSVCVGVRVLELGI